LFNADGKRRLELDLASLITNIDPDISSVPGCELVPDNARQGPERLAPRVFKARQFCPVRVADHVSAICQVKVESLQSALLDAIRHRPEFPGLGRVRKVNFS
jgi:hypothetical protein